MRKYFGEPWDAPVTDGLEEVPTPVGAKCALCERVIEEGDRGFISLSIPLHLGCEMGTTIGHQFGFCSCKGYDDVYERGLALIAFLEDKKK